MNDFVNLVNKIKITQSKQQTFLIGIDGYGGSGKSTVAKFLKENLKDAFVVEMDDFYSPALKRADYDRVNEQVLIPLTNNTKASYQMYDWRSDALGKFYTITPGGIVIVEGVYALHTVLASKYDFKIWVDCPPEIGAKRGIERDKIRDGVDNTDKWINVWMPQEKAYVESQQPQQIADYVVDGASGTGVV